jgi:bla regulator protein blaR1
MIPGLLSHLLQSTLSVGAAWLLALTLRKNRAQVRFWIFFTASVKFFIPFAALVSLGSLTPRHATAPPAVARWIGTIEQIGEPLTAPIAARTAAHAAAAMSPISWGMIALAVWACGFAAIVACWLVRWRRVLVLRRWAPALALEFPVPVMSVPGLLEPGVCGVFRPVLLLPEGIVQRLNSAELDAILAHEGCHVRRRDNLTATIHMAVQATFWFHPLMWWLGARLVEERERACDEEVISLGNTPRIYAAGILNVCRHYVESPLACVSGVTGSNLKRRIEAILANRATVRLNYAKKAALAVTALIALALPIAIGVVHAPIVRAQQVPAQKVGIQGAEIQPAQAAPVPPAQSPAARPRPKFDVASIKPCQPGDGPGRSGKGDMGANGGVNPNMPEGEGGYFRASPGRLDITCGSLLTMVTVAYVEHDKPLLNNPGGIMRQAEVIQGVPKWALAARYTIHAETDDPAANQPTRIGEGRGSRPGPAQGLLFGMLQGLLEDRFQLKIRRVTEEAPLYALTVAKGGFKLKPMKDGDCLPDGPPEWPAGGKPACNWTGWDVNGPNRRLLLGSITLDRLAQDLAELILDRNVIDRTGISGSFVARLEYAPDENTRCFGMGQWCDVDPKSDIPPAATIFTAIEQQFGLKLEPIKGPKEHIVIDSVERPSEN